MAGVSAGESISFEAVAAIYDATRGGLERGVRFAAALAPECGAGPMLEIGVGTGAIALPLRDELGRAVLGLDLSPAMLTTAHQRLGASVGVADVSRLPFADGAIGTVVACWVLHLVGDPAAVLAECRRVLAPGGRCRVRSHRRGVDRTGYMDGIADRSHRADGAPAVGCAHRSRRRAVRPDRAAPDRRTAHSAGTRSEACSRRPPPNVRFRAALICEILHGEDLKTAEPRGSDDRSMVGRDCASRSRPIG